MFPPQKVYLKKKLIGWGKIPALLFLLDFSIIFLYDLITYEIPPLQKGERGILVTACGFPRAVPKFYPAC